MFVFVALFLPSLLFLCVCVFMRGMDMNKYNMMLEQRNVSLTFLGALLWCYVYSLSPCIIFS